MKNLQEKVRSKIDEIAQIILEKPIDFFKIGLYSGNPGVSLFLFYYSRYTHNTEYEEKAMEYLYQTIKNIQLNTQLLYTFSGGISGLCWTIDHLIDNNFIL